MEVRPIDGNALQARLYRLGLWNDSKAAFYELIESMPTLTPPNEPRMINADKLAKRIAGHSNYHGDSILAAIYCAAEGKENDAPIRPIETPPNEPLTLEHLREMDGEPVYCINIDDYSTKEWMIVGKDDCEGRRYIFDFSTYSRSCLAYRRPPEGEA